ncbi:MAG: AMP-binding protein [Caldimonas sp.]
MQITQTLKRAAAAQPDSVATVCGGRRHTFAQVRERVARLAGALQQLGIRPGDRIGILALNSDRYIEAYMAIPWAGAVVNPVNTRWSAAEIAYSLDDCDTRVLLVDDPFVPLLADLRQRSRSFDTVATPEGLLSYETLIDTALPVPDHDRGGNDLAGVFYTGGTTGFPKGAMLSHDALCLNGLVGMAEGMGPAAPIRDAKAWRSGTRSFPERKAIASGRLAKGAQGWR